MKVNESLLIFAEFGSFVLLGFVLFYSHQYRTALLELRKLVGPADPQLVAKKRRSQLRGVLCLLCVMTVAVIVMVRT